ncbi:hypothetical protein HOE37_00850 [Candidatus Woesearchaeota archaeon]|jgi:hypothetical protein|nr:hypothetical protein [Candidatus Woesearchaeota archaeon]MBT4110384.1 hypothetical protein [Candidatus Woesearchaeota archaeon]MBT4336092.1 hypothetical protein [Candidatus Woesearchaeota archaeon]MBT4468929.1 hypothetical protein [Candidatus Woesearchaeota archaeon]MBT6744752.1 hypothetical protein [Candidatus Woesearchaeota archaeon]
MPELLLNLEKEINKILSESGRKIKVLEKEKKSFSNKLKSWERRRTASLSLLNRDSQALNQIKREMNDLEKELLQRKSINEAKTKMILLDIQEKENELKTGKIKLNKIEKMLTAVKAVSGDMPAVIDSFKAEKSKAKTSLKNIEKEMLLKKRQLRSFQDNSFSTQKEFLAKKRNIEQLQIKVLKEKKEHQTLLDNIETSLAAVKRQLLLSVRKESKVQNEKQQKIVKKHLDLNKQIEDISKDLTRTQEAYRKQALKKEEVGKRIKALNQKQNFAMTKLNKNKKSLTATNNQISSEKRKHQSLVEEEQLLRKIVQKIQLERKIKQSLLKKPVYDRLDNYIARLEDEVKSNTWKKIKNVEKEIALEKIKQQKISVDLTRKKVQLKNNLENEKKRLKLKQARANKQAGLKIADLDKEIVVLNRKKGSASKQLEKRKSEIDNEMETKKKELSANRLKLLEKAKTLRKRKSNISNKTANNENILRKLREEEIKLEDKQEKTKANYKAISEKLSDRDKQLKNLNKVVKEKIKRVNDANKLRDELHKLHLIIDEKLPIIKIKTKIVQVVKIKTRIVKEIKRIRVKVKSNVDVDKDLKPALRKIDGLLGKLPKKEINAFSKSKDFKTYKKIMNKYGVK